MWHPRTVLDVGAGPGTAVWASAAVWPGLAAATLLERQEGMISLGKRLAKRSLLPVVQQANWVDADLMALWDSNPHDLVVMAYVLGELPEERRTSIIRRLWQVTGGVLVIVEPGTPAGFVRIRAARDQLLAQGASVVAPCPHRGACPMAQGDWCHFAQRVARSQVQRQVKDAELSYEDEKFSFVAASRDATQGVSARIPARVIRHPQTRPGHIRLELCTPTGLMSIVVTHKDRQGFRAARDAEWGSTFDPDYIRRT